MKFRNYLRVGLILAMLTTSVASCGDNDDPQPANGGGTEQPTPDKPNPDNSGDKPNPDNPGDKPNPDNPGDNPDNPGDYPNPDNPGDKTDPDDSGNTTPETYVLLSFDANSSKVKGSAPEAMRVSESVKLPDAGEMSRLGFQFLGWSADKDAKTADLNPGSDYKTSKAETLYAIWAPVTFKITYKPSGDPRKDFVEEYDGAMFESGNIGVYAYIRTYALNYNLEGDYFVCWEDSDGNRYLPLSPINIDKDIVLKAVKAEPSQLQNWNVIEIDN